MIASLAIILALTIGGTFLTYLYEKEDSLMFRICAGNVIGSAIFGTICFVLACFFGLSTVSIGLSVLITLLPIALLTQPEIRRQFNSNLNKAKGKLEGANLRKFLSFAYYVLIFLLLCLFFDRAMFSKDGAIFTGGSQNLGDLPFHLGAIFSFTEGNNFPTENPSFAGAKFTYPFLVDFIVPCFVKLGASVKDAMFCQNITLGFSLVVLLERFTVTLTKNKLAGKIAPLLLLFSGGLGFVAFFRDYWQDGRSIFEFLNNLSRDYTINGETFRWGNSLVVLFLTQRGFLLGMPIVLIILTFLWKVFATKETDATKEDENFILHPSSFIVLGLLAGLLPLIHVHSLFALFIVCAFLFFFDIKNAKYYLIFGVAVSIIAIPELIWTLTGSASNVSKFIDWHFGWDKGEQNFLVFWAKNIGLFIPLLLIALYFQSAVRSPQSADKKISASPRPAVTLSLLFYAPFAFIFLLCNVVKLAPWEWDNIKVLIYWFVGSIPFVAWLLAWLFEQKIGLKLVASACFIVLTLSGALDVWRVVSRQINYEVFRADSVKIAEQIKLKTPPNALFLNAPTYNSAVVLSGRRSLMRYSGHLSSYGIDYLPRETEVKRIYEGSGLADDLLRKNNIEYVIISPEEDGNLTVNEDFFSKYEKIAESGEYKVYKIK